MSLGLYNGRGSFLYSWIEVHPVGIIGLLWKWPSYRENMSVISPVLPTYLGSLHTSFTMPKWLYPWGVCMLSTLYLDRAHSG